MRTSARRVASIAATGLVVASLVPAAAHASPTWLTPQPISGTSDFFGDYQVAADPAGNAVAVWTRQTGSFYAIEAATRPAGGSWSPSVTLDHSGTSIEVDVAMDGSGVATAVWTTDDYVDGFVVVRASRLPSLTGVWTGGKAVSELDADGVLPRVAVNTAGDTVVIWSSSDTADEVHAAYRPAGGGWAQPEVVSEADLDARNPDVALDAAGTATAVWWLNDTHVVQASVRPKAGGWSAPDDLSEDGVTSDFPQVAAGPTGSATAVWEADVDANASIQSSMLSGGTWSDPVTISDGRNCCFFPMIDVNQSGHAIAGWTDEEGDARAQVALRTPDGTWSPARTLDDAGQQGDGAFVAIDASGTATALWRRSLAGTLEFSRHPLGGTWSAPAEVTADAAGDPAMVTDGDGDVVVTWPAGDNPFVLHAAGLDAAGPRVRSFSAPAAAVPGQGLNYSASATDDWSSVASYSWAFGDGSSATGPWVTHAYSAPGTYAVALTVTDTVGNTTMRSASINVTAVATPPAVLKAPELTVFELTRPRILAVSRAVATAPAKTKLKIGLSTAAQVRLVVRSKHRHLVDGKQKYVKVTLTRSRPAGRSTITLRGRLATIKLPPDTYRIVGSATNQVGTSAKQKVKLKVVAP